MSEFSASIVEYLYPEKILFLPILVLLQPTINFYLSQSLKLPFLLEISISTLIKVSSIAVSMVNVTRCLNPYYLYLDCMSCGKHFTCSGAIPIFLTTHSSSRYSSLLLVTLYSKYCRPNGAKRTYIFRKKSCHLERLSLLPYISERC